MKCPECNKAGCRYNQRNPHRTDVSGKIEFKRTDFTAKCKACGWEGEC